MAGDWFESVADPPGERDLTTWPGLARRSCLRASEELGAPAAGG
jgi:hypothetical protein